MQAMLSPAELEQAVHQARQSAPARVWAALLQITALPPSQLRDALQRHQGVTSFEDGELAGGTLLEPLREPGSTQLFGAWVQVEGAPHLLCADPWAPAAMARLSRRPGSVPALARPHQLERIVLGTGGAAAAPGAGSASPPGSSPVVRFVDDAIARAYQDGASDIHFETDRRGVHLKYRIDGVMAPGERLDGTERAEEVISRIKVMAQLDITERRRPQDGRIHWEGGRQAPLDLRVSIMPSIFGEDAVLRLLDKAQLRHAQQTISLDSLGFEARTAASIRTLAAQPHGMLLVTGPTGSGKTTTVYAALSEVNDGLEKIVTIEDPVEYELPGVLQIPVNEQKGLTFSTGLRSILRHDPDKILVGEIRDAETAEIAVQSALTGHLVMTTVHANSLFDVLGRFQHFGIDPFGLASALNGVIVQRLLRRTCTHCMQWRAVAEHEAAAFAACGLPAPARLPAPAGCDACRQTGYKGRMVVAEVHRLDDLQRDLIVRRAPLLEIKEAVYPAGAVNLQGRALAQAAAGHTTLEEIRRVVGSV
jgi:general secretion pathway protein E